MHATFLPATCTDKSHPRSTRHSKRDAPELLRQLADGLRSVELDDAGILQSCPGESLVNLGHGGASPQAQDYEDVWEWGWSGTQLPLRQLGT